MTKSESRFICMHVTEHEDDAACELQKGVKLFNDGFTLILILLVRSVIQLLDRDFQHCAVTNITVSVHAANVL